MERSARKLKDEAAISLRVISVSSAEGLLYAVKTGWPDIVITDHIDLTTLELLPTSHCEGCVSHLGDITSIRSIRVRNSLFTYCNVCRR
jgi:hypothetical protein